MDWWISQLGIIDYNNAMALMNSLHSQRLEGNIPNIFLLLEHNPVITLGRRAKRQNLLVTPQELQRRGIQLVRTDRGGDVTFHGPGQLVGYFVAKVQNLGETIPDMVERVANIAMKPLEVLGLRTEFDHENPGIWATKENSRIKIGSIGLRVIKGITKHGFARNVNTNLEFFSLINPCGLSASIMGNLKDLGIETTPAEIASLITRDFQKTNNAQEKTREEILSIINS